MQPNNFPHCDLKRLEVKVLIMLTLLFFSLFLPLHVTRRPPYASLSFRRFSMTFSVCLLDDFFLSVSLSFSLSIFFCTKQNSQRCTHCFSNKTSKRSCLKLHLWVFCFLYFVRPHWNKCVCVWLNWKCRPPPRKVRQKNPNMPFHASPVGGNNVDDGAFSFSSRLFGAGFKLNLWS